MLSTRDKLWATLPMQWFSDAAKSIGGIFFALTTVFAGGLDYISAACADTRLQTRLGTATGQNLDNIAADFLNPFPRRPGEPDEAYRVRIQANLLQDRDTRASIINAIETLGATVLEVFEPEQDGFFTDFTWTDGRRISDLSPYEGMFFIARPLNPAYNLLLYTDLGLTDMNYIPNAGVNIWTISDSDLFATINNYKVGGTEIWAVLDPINVAEIV